MDAPSLDYASLLGPKVARKDHGRRTKELCEANLFDQDEYQTLRVYLDCECKFAEVDKDRQAEIVEKDRVSVIEVANGNSTAVLSVSELVDGTTYMAVPHVWSDGLGQPHANALPTC